MRRVLFALVFLGLITVAAVTVFVVATMPDDEPGQLPAEPPLPDGNTRGDALLDWAAAHPDRAKAPEYLEDV